MEKLLQALLILVLLLAVVHPTGQHPALVDKRGRGLKKEPEDRKRDTKVPPGAEGNTHKQGGNVKVASICHWRLVHLRVKELNPE